MKNPRGPALARWDPDYCFVRWCLWGPGVGTLSVFACVFMVVVGKHVVLLLIVV